jgi:hypothetical protein
MKKHGFLFFLSIFEILRWVVIFLLFNFFKSYLKDFDNTIIGENWLWFGSSFFVNVLFALSGILCFINMKKYFIMTKFWSAYKLVFIVYIVFLLFFQKIQLNTYFIILAPIDFFLFFYLIFLDFNEKENEAINETSEVDSGVS